MKEFIIRDGKKLRLGYTTGSCAAAAAKPAAWMLLSGSKKESIRLLTPKGMELTLAVEDICLSPDCVRCAIRKDSGDDPDITRDTLIYAEVRKTETVGIVIDGGQGVGRVTKPGLDQPVGAAAINSVPRLLFEAEADEFYIAFLHGISSLGNGYSHQSVDGVETHATQCLRKYVHACYLLRKFRLLVCCIGHNAISFRALERWCR